MVRDGQRREVDAELVLGALAQAERASRSRPSRPPGRPLAATNELAEVRHAGSGQRADQVGRDGHVAPAEHREALLGGEAPRCAVTASGALGVVGRAGRRCPRRTRPAAGSSKSTTCAEELVGHLGEDAGAVADLRRRRPHRGARGCAGRSGRGRRCRGPACAAQRGDDGHAAGVVLVLAAVEPGVCGLGGEAHGITFASPSWGSCCAAPRPRTARELPGAHRSRSWTALATAAGRI